MEIASQKDNPIIEVKSWICNTYSLLLSKSPEWDFSKK
jgi:hypothetical protein